MAGENPERTGSLFNVTPARRRSYLVAFVALSLAGYGVVIWHHVSGGPALVDPGSDGSASTTAMSIMLGFAIAHAAALGLALTVAEITGGTMVIADWLREKYVTPLKKQREAERERQRAEGRVEGRAEGRVEGRAEVNHTWREWNRRRREAEARGEDFNEPEPYSNE